MIGVTHQALSVQEGLYYYQGQLFTGVCFYVDEQGRVTNKNRIEEGLLRGQYSDPYFPNPSGWPEMDIDWLQDDEGGSFEVGSSFFYYAHEQPFTGVVYLFAQEKCLLTKWVENGRSIGSVRYRTLDEVQKLSIKVNDIRQVYELDAEGRLVEYKVAHLTEDIVLKLLLTPAGQIRSLKISQDYFSHYPQLRPHLHFDLFPSIDSLLQLPLNDRVTLFGGGIDDEVWQQLLLRNDQLHAIKRLTLTLSKISGASLLQLHPEAQPNQLRIAVDEARTPQTIFEPDLRTFKARYPQCDIRLILDNPFQIIKL